MKAIVSSVVITAIGACILAGGAAAQDYPNKTIRLIVPYPPGGGNDALARLFGQKLSAAWGQQVIVDNRPGAGTTIGTTLAARAAPDGTRCCCRRSRATA